MKSINILTGHTFGGILSVYKVLIPELEKDFLINLITFDDNSNNEIVQNIPQINLNVKTPITGIRMFTFIYKFISVSRNNNLNVFIINNPSIGILVYLSSIIYNVKYFIHSHEPLTNDINNKSAIIKYFYLFLLKKAFKNALSVICTSESVEKNLKFYLNINNTRIIANPVLINNILSLSKEKLEQEFTKSEFNFVTVGRLTKAKGFSDLIKAVNIVKNLTNKSFKVYIIGNGEEYNDLKFKISELKLNNIIELLGYIENPYPYISNSDCYLSTSLWEGFGLTLVYAMLLKKPIITSKTGGALELLEINNSFYDIGNVEDLSNKMLKYIDNNSINNSILELNYNNATKYDVSNISKIFKKLIYEKVPYLD